MGWIQLFLERHFGTRVISVNTTSTGTDFGDFLSGFFGNVNEQVARVCQTLRAEEALHGGFNMIGFSQGGQFARAVVQRCGHTFQGPIRSLITFGAQHQGVIDVPGCKFVDRDAAQYSICQAVMRVLGEGAYLPYVRDHIVQAQYFKAPAELENYLRFNPFLPDINNEVASRRSAQYKRNLLSLDRFVLVRFRDDFTVVPRDSAWFSWHDGTNLIPLNASELYSEDWLGLRGLQESGRLVFDEMPGMHMEIDVPLLVKMLTRYLS